MAYNKIRVIHTRLDNAVRYVLNREKTADPETGRVLESAINCMVETAYRDMDVKAGAQDTISDVSEVDKITLISQHQNVVANCFKVFPSQKMLGGKNGPSYTV